MITYETRPSEPANFVATVNLDGKTIGGIKRVLSGFQYVPKGQNKVGGIKGTVFSTIAEVRASIEGSDND